MPNSLVETYLKSKDPGAVAPGFLAYLANLECVSRVAPDVARSIVQELADQRSNVKMIASENFSSLATQCAMANLLTDKYAEGIPHHRFYAGCDNVDSIEELADLQARELFVGRIAYAQPHSGADANLVAFWAVLRARVEIPEMVKASGAEGPDSLAPASWYKLTPEQWRAVRQALGSQRLLGMDLASGGHLTHGYRLNVSGKMFEAHGYTVDKSTFLLDYDAIERQAVEVKPLILLAGFSAYSRNINYARMRAIADRAGAVLMVDMAHFAGLVAGKVLQGEFNPIPYAHIVTTTTHKTLRGLRGGCLSATSSSRSTSTGAVHSFWAVPSPTSWPPRQSHSPRRFGPAFAAYAHRIVDNARALGEAFVRRRLSVLTGGTDNHLLVLDVASTHGITGRQAEDAVRRCGITLNRNPIPFDSNGPWYTSGLRFGTAAVTTLGMAQTRIRRDRLRGRPRSRQRQTERRPTRVLATRPNTLSRKPFVASSKHESATCSTPSRSTPVIDLPFLMKKPGHEGDVRKRTLFPEPSGVPWPTGVRASPADERPGPYMIRPRFSSSCTSIPCQSSRVERARNSVTSHQRPVAVSLRLREGCGIHLIQDLELRDSHDLDLLAVARDLDLGGLFDSAEVLVVGEACLRGGFPAPEAEAVDDLFDGQSALLVEVEREFLAVGPGHLQEDGRFVADFLVTGSLVLETVALDRHERDRDDLKVDIALLVGEGVAVQLRQGVPDLYARSSSPARTTTRLNWSLPNSVRW